MIFINTKTMHPARKASLKSKILADLAYSSQDDNEVTLLCHSAVAKCFVAHMKRISVQSALSYSSPVEVGQGLVQMYISLTTNEAEQLLNDYVQGLQETDLETIVKSHRHIFVGGQDWTSKSDYPVS
jgi:hypothetical protein